MTGEGRGALSNEGEGQSCVVSVDGASNGQDNDCRGAMSSIEVLKLCSSHSHSQAGSELHIPLA